MTLEELRERPIGILEARTITFKLADKSGAVREYEEYFLLVKGENSKYFIGFSVDGSCCSNTVSEVRMLNLINHEDISEIEAMDIYMSDPQLSSWVGDMYS